jgi:hypothetical protein
VPIEKNKNGDTYTKIGDEINDNTKMSNEGIAPPGSSSGDLEFQYCIGSECAWYKRNSNDCAILAIAEMTEKRKGLENRNPLREP